MKVLTDAITSNLPNGTKAQIIKIADLSINYDDETVENETLNTFACKIRESYEFCGVDGSGSKKEMFKRLNDHEATALTVLDTFDPVGSNMESD